MCPEPTVKKPGSGRSPGTLENEKLPFAMRWCYSSLNYGYAAEAVYQDAAGMIRDSAKLKLLPDVECHQKS
jgi:hypothetical protein